MMRKTILWILTSGAVILLLPGAFQAQQEPERKARETKSMVP